MNDEYHFEEEYYPDGERYQYDTKYNVTVRDYSYHTADRPEEEYTLTPKEEEWALTGEYSYEIIDDETGEIETITDNALGEDAYYALLWKKSYLSVRGTPTELQRVKEELDIIRKSDKGELYEDNKLLRATNNDLNSTIDLLNQTIEDLREQIPEEEEPYDPEPPEPEEPYVIVVPESLKDKKELVEAVNKLNGLIGLNSVKKHIGTIINGIEFNKRFPDSKAILGKNLVLTGNPGTGKTTVARLMGPIYKGLGVVTEGHFVQATKSDLIGEALGTTAPKVIKMFKKANKGILFIDEAYDLVGRGDDLYGKEALATMVSLMNDDGTSDIAVILAGYEDKVKNMLRYNEGMVSRFNTFINFADYTPEQLYEIWEYDMRNRNFTISEEATEILKDHFKEMYSRRTEGFANARYVNKVFSNASAALVDRYIKEDLHTKPEFSVDDVEIGIMASQNMEGMNYHPAE